MSPIEPDRTQEKRSTPPLATQIIASGAGTKRARVHKYHEDAVAPPVGGDAVALATHHLRRHVLHLHQSARSQVSTSTSRVRREQKYRENRAKCDERLRAETYCAVETAQHILSRTLTRTRTRVLHPIPQFPHPPSELRDGKHRGRYVTRQANAKRQSETPTRNACGVRAKYT